MISVSVGKQDMEVEIHMDQAGIAEMISILESLKNKKDHTHLMTAEWGGGELSSELQNTNLELSNKLTLFSWTK